MFKQTVIGLTCFLLGLAGGMGAITKAQPYLGVRVIVSEQLPNGNAHDCRWATYVYCNDQLATPNLYAGYRLGDWSVEVGGGKLGERVSHNVSPAYDITQEVRTKHFYTAALRHFGSLHLMAGLSKVWMDNHEYGWNDAGPNQVQRNSSNTIAPILGFGVSHAIGKVSLRFDAFHIREVAISHWTRSSNVTALSFGAQVNF